MDRHPEVLPAAEPKKQDTQAQDTARSLGTQPVGVGEKDEQVGFMLPVIRDKKREGASTRDEN